MARQVFGGVHRRDDPAFYIAAVLAGVGISAIFISVRTDFFEIEAAAVLAVVCVVAAIVLSRLSRIFIADDGGTGSPFGRRFIPFSTIRSIEFLPEPGSIGKNPGGTIVLYRHAAPEVRLRAAKLNAGRVLAAIQQAFAAASARARQSYDHRLLDRAGSAAAVWLGRLRTLAPGVDTFRAGTPSRADLVALLDDVHADEDQRIAAAVILAQHGGAEDRARLTSVATGTASPRLRVAVEATLAADDDALTKALDERVRI